MSDESLIPTERPRHWRLLDRLLEGGGTVLVVAVLWAAFGLFLVLIHGLMPNSLGRWLLYVFLAPLVWIVGEALVEGFQAIPLVKRARSSIDEKTQSQVFSGTRVVYLLFEAIVFLTLFIAIIWALGALGISNLAERSGADFDWSNDSDAVVLRVSRQGGISRGRRIFTLYGSGELRMERYAGNHQQKLEERSKRLSDKEVRDLLQGIVDSRVPQWTGEALRISPVREQIPRAVDSPYLEISVSLSYYPPLGGPVDHVAGFPIESMRSAAPVLETFIEVLAAWDLEAALRGIWEEVGAEL